jgi:amino-acid N-acetyltransferase
MIIRKAKNKDKKAIKKLIAMFPGFLMKQIPDIKSFFVAEEDKTIVGCCALDIYSKKIAEVRSLAVLNKYRNKGVATELVNRCLEKAKQRGIYEVLAITSREKLFKRLGFGPFHKERLALLKILREEP